MGDDVLDFLRRHLRVEIFVAPGHAVAQRGLHSVEPNTDRRQSQRETADARDTEVIDE